MSALAWRQEGRRTAPPGKGSCREGRGSRSKGREAQ